MLSVLRRIAPALLLVVLAPTLAEFLQGNIPLSRARALLFILPLYGGGALLIREVARHTGRSWGTIITLGLAYALVEEANATQSLFNPDYLGFRLLDYGYIPGLGIGAPWTAYVLSLHVVWSILTPIALTETLFRERRTIPWLGPAGLTLTALLFLWGVGYTAWRSWDQSQFMADPMQLIVSGAIVLVLIALAFLLSARKSPQPTVKGTPLKPWAVGLIAFLAGSFFILGYGIGQQALPAPAVVTVILTLDSGMIAFFFRESRKAEWSDLHRFALTAGTVLVYCWWGFLNHTVVLGPRELPGQAVIAAAFIALLVLAGRRRSASLRTDAID